MALALTSTPPAFVSRADAVSTDYVVYVAAPGETAPDGGWPAIVVLDADHFFDAAVSAARELQVLGAIEPVLVAGVGYGRSFGHPANRRGRDFTPRASVQEPGSGGAAGFLEHLADRLWPELARRFPVDRARSVLAGHSLSALFVLYATFQPRPFLARALAGAPSIWWDNRSLLTDLARLRDAHANLPAALYLGVGEDETPSMLGDLALLEQQLDARPFVGLRVTTERFPRRNHVNVLPDLFRGGFRALLGGAGR